MAYQVANSILLKATMEQQGLLYESFVFHWSCRAFLVACNGLGCLVGATLAVAGDDAWPRPHSGGGKEPRALEGRLRSIGVRPETGPSARQRTAQSTRQVP